MARLIDADALIKRYDLHIVIGAGDNICIDIADIAKAPTVDAVPVVRCCQCSRRYDADECPMCHLVEGEYNEYTADDGFCDRGEMRTDGVKMDLEVE